MLGHIDYIRFSVRIGSGEYVPYEVDQEHKQLRTKAVRWRCLQCRKEP